MTNPAQVKIEEQATNVAVITVKAIVAASKEAEKILDRPLGKQDNEYVAKLAVDTAAKVVQSFMAGEKGSDQ